MIVGLPQRDMHRPVVAALDPELAGPVERVDDPDPLCAEAGLVVDSLLGEHRVRGPFGRQPLQQQRVSTFVAGRPETLRVVEPKLGTHLQEQLSGFVGEFCGKRGIGKSHPVSITRSGFV